MDLPCPKCGDPIDNDYLHDIVEDGEFSDYRAALHAFQSQGCVGINMPCNTENGNSYRAMVSDAMFDLMGDDSDGVANMMEDFDYLFN